VAAATEQFDPNAHVRADAPNSRRDTDRAATRRQQVLFLVLLVKLHIDVQVSQGAACTTAINWAASFLRSPDAWAPAEHVARECAYMPQLRAARAGVIAACCWRHIVIPPDMRTVYGHRQWNQQKRREAAAAALEQPEHGNVQQDMPML
jgi:hypothetical protein